MLLVRYSNKYKRMQQTSVSLRIAVSLDWQLKSTEPGRQPSQDLFTQFLFWPMFMCNTNNYAQWRQSLTVPEVYCAPNNPGINLNTYSWREGEEEHEKYCYVYLYMIPVQRGIQLLPSSSVPFHTGHKSLGKKHQNTLCQYEVLQINCERQK